MQLTLHPLEDGGESNFQVHSRPYGVRDAEWSLNADGTVVTGVDDEPAPETAEAVDAAIERLNRMRPQELFETFADMELAWGPNWSGSLKSLWLGEGEAIGDIIVGEELAEHLGTEPMHPVLMDLCTGVAFPAFPALLAAEQGVNDLFLPLRYGQVMLREKMPRRFYCRAKWHTSDLDSETQVFDLDFVDRDGRQLGGIREFTVKRAPREALLRGLGGDATRLLYTLGWHEVPPPAASDGAGGANGTWLIAGFDELAANVPGCIPFDRTTDSEPLGQVLAQAHERGVPFPASSGAARRPAQRSRAPMSPRGSRAEIANLLSAVHTVQGGSQNGSVKLPDGLWIITEHAVATESGEPVDPVQAALWGFGRTTDQRGTGAALQTGRLRRIRGGGARTGQPARHTDRGAGTRTAARKVAGVALAALGAQRSSRGTALERLRPGAHRTRRDRQPASDRDGRAAAGRGLRAGPGGGRGSQLPGCAQRARPLPGRPRTDRRGLRRHRHPVG